ncbi:hypothetical protein B9Z55_026594 [Caenorhabditis nigoni]|uniref:Protein kinase domain-containing protein n=2 Tax=Caenorhabditis nigoni TaxID=1611254 RepID=A0A2G5T405_9PELO|nr:hypothetical protein B9Z55_026594 [Caenorhabditis nigoni]
MDNIKRIGRKIGEAMLHLEKLNLYHLDLKISNVVFTSNVKYELDLNLTQTIITMSNFDIKVIDYGSSMTHSKPGYPKPVMLVQPRNMRAPEVFMSLPHNEKSDVWSMGCLMAELYTGKLLFCSNVIVPDSEKEQSHFETMISIMNASVPIEMVKESKQRGECTLNFNFLNDRKEVNNQDSLMSLMREDNDSPLFDLLKFMLVFDPSKRPSFEEVIRHKFFKGV